MKRARIGDRLMHVAVLLVAALMLPVALLAAAVGWVVRKVRGEP